MFRTAILAVALFGLTSAPARAMSIAVDEILYDSSTNLGSLSGTIEMVLSGNVLSITLTNTSLDSAGSGAGVLLTGIGFSLPTDVWIASGTVGMGSSTAVNFSKPADGDVSEEWGYDNSPLNSGMFKDSAALTYNTVVASMESMTTKQFAPGSISQPPNLGGPDFGLASAAETDGFGGGVEAIRSSILISLTLGGNYLAYPNLVYAINSGSVGLSFGSPNTSNKVPEPASLLLLSTGALAAFGLRRRRQAVQ